MGRHSADDGAGVDPVVAAALAQRPSPAAPAEPRHATGLVPVGADGTGGLGWPGDPADGNGLGWPARDGDAAADAVPVDRPARRRGWRRLFGGAARQDSTAA